MVSDENKNNFQSDESSPQRTTHQQTSPRKPALTMAELRGKDENSPLMAHKGNNKRRDNVDSTNPLSEQWSLLQGVPFPECTSRYEQEAFDDYLEATRPGHKALAAIRAFIREETGGQSLTEAGLELIQEAKLKIWKELSNGGGALTLELSDMDFNSEIEDMYGPSATPALSPHKARKARTPLPLAPPKTTSQYNQTPIASTLIHPKERKVPTPLPLALPKTTNEYNQAPITPTPLSHKAPKAPTPLLLASPKTTNEINQTILTSAILPPNARKVPTPLPLASPKTTNEYNQAPLTPHKSLPKRPVVEIPSSRQTPYPRETRRPRETIRSREAPHSRDSSPPAKRVAGHGGYRPVAGPRDRSRVTIDLTQDDEPYLASPQQGRGGPQARHRGGRGQGQSSPVASGIGMFAMGAQSALTGNMQNRGGSSMQSLARMGNGHPGFISGQMNSSATRTPTGRSASSYQSEGNSYDRTPSTPSREHPRLPTTSEPRIVTTIHFNNKESQERALQMLQNWFDGQNNPGCSVVESGNDLDIRGPPGRNMRGFIRDRFPRHRITSRIE